MSKHALFGLMTIFTIVVTPAHSQSTLSETNSQELQRLLQLQTSKQAIQDRTPSFTLNDLMVLDARHPPPKNAFERLLKWHDIALDTTALDHTPVHEPRHGLGLGRRRHLASRA
jgi:hypothetical protein